MTPSTFSLSFISFLFVIISFIAPAGVSTVHALALGAPTPTLKGRTYPYFPADPPSCPICQKDYPNINSCAEAAPVLANFSQIIFNPGAFIQIIECACTDTFKSAFPQCVDCFIRTNQSWALETPDLPSVVDGMRRICALESTLLGNVSGVNNASALNPSPTPSSALARMGMGMGIWGMVWGLVGFGVAVLL